MDITVTDIYEYPLKSSKGNRLDSVEIDSFGLKNDRKVAVIDAKNRIRTGREHPELVHISSEIKGDVLVLKSPGMEDLVLSLHSDNSEITAKLFRNQVRGALLGGGSSEWISSVLKGDFKLIRTFDASSSAVTKPAEDRLNALGYADSAPVHLINLKTLEYLNSKLDQKVGLENFRPNIVVDGNEPFEEDQWSELSINGCRLKLQELTERCIFTTIDPKTAVKDPEVEPLSTLAGIRRLNGERATFGIDLKPLNSGTISVGDMIILENRVEGN